MSAYIIYFIIVLIFLFLILHISKAINRGIEAKDKIISKEKKYFQMRKQNLIQQIKLKDLREDKILSQMEFKKIKNKLLNY